MKYEDLPNRVMYVYDYPTGLIENPVVMEAVNELVSDRKKILADKRALMLEVMQLKERLRTSSGLPEEDGSKSASSPSGRRDEQGEPSQGRSRRFGEDSI